MMPSTTTDPLKKREEFAISLRRKKKTELIANKRKRLNNIVGEQMPL